jgi:hypothetical protein
MLVQFLEIPAATLVSDFEVRVLARERMRSARMCSATSVIAVPTEVDVALQSIAIRPMAWPSPSRRSTRPLRWRPTAPPRSSYLVEVVDARMRP